MRYSVFSHCNGLEKVPVTHQNEISSAICAVDLRVTKGSASTLRSALLAGLIDRGWSKPVSVSRDSALTITSIKANTGLCLQTGNMARMYADLLKLQKLFLDRAIHAGVMIVPSEPMAKAMGQNVTHACRLERELEIFESVIDIPTIVFAME